MPHATAATVKVAAGALGHLARLNSPDADPAGFRPHPEEIAEVAEASGFDIRKLRMVVTCGNLVVFPPLVVFELIWIRMLMSKRFKWLRTNIIVVLQKR